jgi:hypothetical protein
MKNIELEKVSENEILVKGKKLTLRWKTKNGDILEIWSEVDHPNRWKYLK